MPDTPSCQRCETLPAVPAGTGTLYLRFPLDHSRGKVLSWLHSCSAEVEMRETNARLRVQAGQLTALLHGLAERLTTMEQEAVRVLFQTDQQAAEPEDFLWAEPLNRLQARCDSAWLISMLQEQRLTSWFQPIVEVRAPDRVFAHECLVRGEREGSIVNAGQIIEAARDSGLLFQLDLAARKSALISAARKKVDTHLFINFSPAAIYDPQFCLRSTLATLDELGIERSRCVFEVTESEHVADRDHLIRILTYYRASGFRVALDDLGSGYSSLMRLHEIRPDFVKLDRSLIENAHQDEFKAMIAAKLLEAAQALGILTVAEGVETAGEMAWVQEHGADYVQGYYIARPAPTPWQPATHGASA